MIQSWSVAAARFAGADSADWPSAADNTAATAGNTVAAEGSAASSPSAAAVGTFDNMDSSHSTNPEPFAAEPAADGHSDSAQIAESVAAP